MDSKDGLSKDGSSGEQKALRVRPIASLLAVAGTSTSCVTELEAMSNGDSGPTGRTTPDPCSICLGAIVNKAFTDSCMHQFCFACLKQWSKVKAECPLCKQSFKSIYYNVRSMEDYKEYVLPIRPPPPRTLGVVMVNFPEHETIDQFRRRMRGGDVVSTYLDYVVRLETAMQFHTLPRAVASVRPQRRRRQVGTSSFRRSIYQRNLWVQRQSDVTGRVRESSPEFYRDNPAMVHRLVPWLNRELNVLCSAVSQEVTALICDLILRMPIRSRNFANQISRYTGPHTDHFVHEFYSYATTPYDLVGFDREANYVRQDAIAHDSPLPITSSSDEEVQEVFYPWAETDPVPINVASDSDDCVIINTVTPSPEVINLEPDDDGVPIASTSTNSIPLSQPGPSGTVRRRKRSSRRTSTSVNFSINIDLSTSETESDFSPVRWRTTRKKIKKKTKSDKNKNKPSKKASKSSYQKDGAALKNKPNDSKSDSSFSMLPLKKRTSRLIVSNSSSDDDPGVLQIDAEPELLALIEPETSEIKRESIDESDVPCSTDHDSPGIKTENKCFVKKYKTRDSESSDSSCHSSYRRLSTPEIPRPAVSKKKVYLKYRPKVKSKKSKLN